MDFTKDALNNRKCLNSSKYLVGYSNTMDHKKNARANLKSHKTKPIPLKKKVLLKGIQIQGTVRAKSPNTIPVAKSVFSDKKKATDWSGNIEVEKKKLVKKFRDLEFIAAFGEVKQEMFAHISSFKCALQRQYLEALADSDSAANMTKIKRLVHVSGALDNALQSFEIAVSKHEFLWSLPPLPQNNGQA